ncbi:MAG: response regulator [Desulfobacula sp.]|uniref:hybrid sensor histidine kinase/response regulator n=1 Tax=Desulfobacula sp. TaxID=2593537 RepID=UPI001EB2D26C|nr:response regulator [Desulfobacula sp.]
MNLPKNIRSNVADRTVRIVAPAMIASMLIMMLTILLDSEKQYQRLIPALIIIITMIPPWILAVKGKPIAGAIIVIFNFCLGILSGMIFSGGVQAPAYIGILVLITITIVLFGSRGGIIFAVLSLSLGGLFLWFDVNGMLQHVDPPSPVFILVLLAVFLAMQFFYVLIPVRLMDKALSESQERGIKLQHTIFELKKSEKQFRDLFNSISDLIYKQDMEGRFILVNPAMKQLFGYEMEEFIGHRASEFMEPELQYGFGSRYLEVIKKQGHHEGIGCYYKKNKEKIYIEYQSALVKPDDAEPYINGIGRDVTEKVLSEGKVRKLQEQVVQSQKMESVGRLAGGVAHDYNNALTSIMGFTELAMMDADPKGPLHADLSQVLKSAKRAKDITRQLLAFARKQTIAPVVLDLNETVESMFKMLRRLIGEDIDLVWMPGKVLGNVKMDPSQIDQILANLCVNARDAIEGVGKITIETGKITFDEAYCADHTGFIPGEFVLLAVSDNGCGMDKEILNNIFEPFFTTKPVDKGTGLGLSTVFGIVKQNNGFINVYSEPGKGTSVKIYLPLYEDEAVEIQRGSTGKIPQGQGETILLVEDDLSILKLAQKILERLNYTVLIAGTPKEGIKLAQDHTGEIYLLVTDVIMPEMNGLELSKQLKQFYPDLKCIFMSGYTANAIAHHGVLDEGVHFVQKPFAKKDLASIVRKVLDQ